VAEGHQRDHALHRGSGRHEALLPGGVGLPIVFEDPNSEVFRFGSTLVNLLDQSAASELVEPATVAGAGSGSRTVFTIKVNDVDATCAMLAERGVTLLNGPMDRPWGVRTASFFDPGGHIWEIAT
jgi:uncharacterized glyoxalase superfamily protein PhnB